MEKEALDATSGGSSQPMFDIVPVPLLDTTVGLTDIMASTVFIVPQILDLEKLRSTWNQVSLAWPMSNARIRECSSSPSGLVYYIPTAKGMQVLESNPDHRRRQFFGLDCRHQSVAAYSPAMEYAKNASQGEVQVWAGPTDDAGIFYTSQNGGNSFDQMLTESIGMQTCQVTLFSDATMITVQICHVLGDGFLTNARLHAWIDALHGKKPKPMKDAALDAFKEYAPGGKLATISREELARGLKPPIPKGYHVYSTLDKLKFMKNVLYDMYWLAPERDMQGRYIHLSHDFVNKLHKQANADLSSLPLNQASGTKAPTVGKSDVLYAWVLRHCLAGLPLKRVINPVTIVNLRGRTPNSTRAAIEQEVSDSQRTWPRHEFLNAAMTTPLGDITIAQLRTQSLGEVAWMIRQGVLAGIDPTNVANLLTFNLHYALWKNRASNPLTLFCHPDAGWTALTDWRALQFAKHDWSIALPDSVLDERRKKGVTKPLKLNGLHAHMITPHTKRSRFAVLGETQSGVWLGGFMAKRQWEDKKHGFGRWIVEDGDGRTGQRMSRL